MVQAFRSNSVTPVNVSVSTVEGDSGSSTVTRNNSRRSSNSKTPQPHHGTNYDPRFVDKFSSALTERNAQVYQGDHQGRSEDEHVGSPSFLAGGAPGDADSLVPRTSESSGGGAGGDGGGGAVASFPLGHQLRSRHTEGRPDSRASHCLDDAGQDIRYQISDIYSDQPPL